MLTAILTDSIKLLKLNLAEFKLLFLSSLFLTSSPLSSPQKITSLIIRASYNLRQQRKHKVFTSQDVMSCSEGNGVPVTSPCNIMNEKVPGGLTFPSILSSESPILGQKGCLTLLIGKFTSHKSKKWWWTVMDCIRIILRRSIINQDLTLWGSALTLMFQRIS